jgi:hypothetical protein
MKLKPPRQIPRGPGISAIENVLKMQLERKRSLLMLGKAKLESKASGDKSIRRYVSSEVRIQEILSEHLYRCSQSPEEIPHR